MRTDYLDELGDTLFVIAMAGAIGFGAANLVVQVTKERAAFDAAAISQKAGQLVGPAPSTYIPAGEPAGQLGY
jgi:hypothetical protein